MKLNVKKIVLLLITFVFLYFVFVNLNISEFIKVFKKFNYLYLFLLFISAIISQLFRAICFKQLIYKSLPDAKLPFLLSVCLTGSGLNIFLPARAGDVFRAYFTGEKYNCSRMKIFGSVMLERLFDVTTIFLFLCLAIFVYHKNPLAIKLCIGAGTLFFFGIAAVLVLYKYKKANKIFDFIDNKVKNFPIHDFLLKAVSFIRQSCNSFFSGFEVIDSPKRIIYAIIASIGIWAFECINFLIIIQAFGYNLHWSISLFIVCFTALACMIPSASIFIGPYQVAVIAAFAIYDIPKETALAISILEQTAVAILFAVITFIFLLKNNISLSELKKNIQH